MSNPPVNHARFQNNYPPSNTATPVVQTPVPVADMTGTAGRQETPATEREIELDTRLRVSAEKANNKRDLEDDDYTLGKRKSALGSASTASKRQRQSTAKAVEATASPTANTKAFEESGEATRVQRSDIIERLKAIWGADTRSWPVFEFSPTRLVKIQRGPQKGRELKKKDEPLDWSLELLNELLHLVNTVSQDQHGRAIQVLKDTIQDRIGDTAGSKTMCPHDLRLTYQILTQGSQAGPSNRSPTIAAAITSNASNDEGDDIVQPCCRTERVDSPLISDEPAIRPGVGSTSTALEGSSVDFRFFERFIDNSVESNKRYMKIMQEIVEDKERYHLAMSEKRQRLRTEFVAR